MSWRVVVTVIISIFVLVVLSAATAGPLYEATDTITDADENAGSGDQFDSGELANAGQRAYGNLFLILFFGTFGWASWYLLRRELSTGRL